MQTTLAANGGVLPLPLIKNKKTVNPRDSSSAPVFQLETAMGSAIECFDGATAVVVPRTRFAPVKTTGWVGNAGPFRVERAWIALRGTDTAVLQLAHRLP
jgi:hypothetical protein